MATPTIVAVYTANSRATTSLNVTSVVSGDWLVAIQAVDFVSMSVLVVPTGAGAGSAWSEIGGIAGNLASCNVKMRAWYKSATGSGTYGVSVTQSSSTSGNLLIVYHLRGCTAIDGTPTVNQATTGTALSAGAIDPVETDSLLIMAATGIQFTNPNATTMSVPSGMTVRQTSNSNEWDFLRSWSEVLASGASTGTRTSTASPSMASGWATKMFAISGVVDIRFGSPTAPLSLDASLAGQKRMTAAISATDMALSTSIAAFKRFVAAPTAPLTLAASLVQGGLYKAFNVSATDLALAASVPVGFGRKVIPVSATALTLGATQLGNKIGVGAPSTSAVSLDASVANTKKIGVSHPIALLILAAEATNPIKTGGQPIPVTRPPLPPLEQPLRLIAQQILTGQFLDWDLPVLGVEITHTLSGPTLIRGRFKPEMQAVRELGLDAWSTFIHAEIDGEIRASGILMPVSWDEEEMAFEAMGFSGYADGLPYLGPEFGGIFVDPLNMVRYMWSHIQSYPEGNLGVVLDSTTSTVRVGEPAKLEPELDEDGNTQTVTTDTKDDIPGSKTNKTKVVQSSVSTTVWNNLLSYGYEANQITADGVLAIFATEYDFNKAKGVPVQAGDSSTNTIKMKETEAKPYALVYWDLIDMGQEVNDLAKATPFDYYEKAYWNGDKTDVLMKLGLAYPRKGTKRLDLRFVQGENILDVVQVAEGMDTFASEVIVIGSGEGRDAIRGYTGERFAKRLRRVAFSNQKNITSQQAADALAGVELLSRRGRMLEFSEITVDAQHPNAILGEYETGDDIYVQVDLPWVGELGIWHRITSYTYRPDRDLVTINLKRSDSFRYGGTI